MVAGVNMQGAAHQEALRWGPTSAGPGAPLDSRKGVLGFFSSGSNGGALESEIGQAEAARFHQIARWASPAALALCGKPAMHTCTSCTPAYCQTCQP